MKDSPKDMLDQFFGFKVDIDELVPKLGYDKPAGPNTVPLHNLLIDLLVMGSIAAITNSEKSMRYSADDIINDLLEEWSVKAKASKQYGPRVMLLLACFNVDKYGDGRPTIPFNYAKITAGSGVMAQLILKLYMFIALLRDKQVADKTITLYDYVNTVKYNIFEYAKITMLQFMKSLPNGSSEVLNAEQYKMANIISQAYHKEGSAIPEKDPTITVTMLSEETVAKLEDYYKSVAEKRSDEYNLTKYRDAARGLIDATSKAYAAAGKLADVTYMIHNADGGPAIRGITIKELGYDKMLLPEGAGFAFVGLADINQTWNEPNNMLYHNRILNCGFPVAYNNKQAGIPTFMPLETFDRPDHSTLTRVVIFVVIAVISLIGIAYVCRYVLQPRLSPSDGTLADIVEA